MKKLTIAILMLVSTICLFAQGTITNGTLSFPAGTTAIKNSAYQTNQEIKHINFPSSLKTIGSNAFRFCVYIDDDLVLPEGLESVGNFAFYNCVNVHKITVPASVTSIGENAFCKNTSLIVKKNSAAHNWAVANGYDYQFTASGLPTGVTVVYQDFFLKTAWDQRVGKLQFAPNRERTLCGNLADATIMFYNGVNYQGSKCYATSEDIYFADFDNNKADLTKIPRLFLSSYSDEKMYDADLFLWNQCMVTERIWGSSSRESPSAYLNLEEANLPVESHYYQLKRDDSETGNAYKTKEELETLIKSNLAEKHPVMIYAQEYGGQSNHGWVVDGARMKDGKFQIHCNFGWGGIYDGWYSIWDPIVNGMIDYHDPYRHFRFYRPLTKEELATWEPIRLSDAQKKAIKAEKIKIPCVINATAYTPEGSTVIIANAFKNSATIEALYIPSTTQIINTSAFEGCSNVSEVIIPESVTRINSNAFKDCTALKSVYYNAQNCTYGGSGSSAFGGCTNLSKVVIGKEVKEIPPFLFRYCTNIVEVAIPANVESIGSLAFPKTTKINCIAGSYAETWATQNRYPVANVSASVMNAAANGAPTTSAMFAALASSSSSSSTNNIVNGVLTIPNGTTEISTRAYAGNKEIKSVIIPNTVKSIGTSAFASCSNISEITIPESVESLSIQTFSQCSGIKTVYFNAINCTYGGENNGRSAFVGCSSLEKVVFGNKVKTIPTQVFRETNSIKDVTIPGNVETISKSAFFDSKVENAIIESGVKTIGDNVFDLCASLKTITIPATVTSIGTLAIPKTAKVICPQGSYAETWAKNNGNAIENAGTAVSNSGSYTTGNTASTNATSTSTSSTSSTSSTNSTSQTNSTSDASGQNETVLEMVISLYNQEKYDDIFELFSAAMARVLNLESTKTFFGSRMSNYGKITEKSYVSTKAKYVEYHITYEKGTATFNFGVDTQGKINYLQFTNEKKTTEAETAVVLGPDDPVSIETSPTHFVFPSNETWYTLWGGKTKNQNYHVGANIYKGAYDFYIIGETKHTYKSNKESLSDYYCYNLPLYSPCDGTVVNVVNDAPEYVPPERNTKGSVGNTVKIRTVNNEYLVIAHMATGSVVVKVGQQVKQGDLLGKCGNSGNSSEPHIHIHLQNQEANGGAMGLQMVFSDIIVNGEKKDRWSPIKYEKVSNGAGQTRTTASTTSTSSTASSSTTTSSSQNAIVNGVLTIPEGTVQIPARAYANNAEIVSVVIPSSLKTIGTYAFQGCKNLTEITIPKSVIEIKMSAFNGSGLTKVVIEEGCKILGTYVFYNSRSLREITLPASLTNIGTSAIPKTTKVICPVGSYAGSWAKQNGNSVTNRSSSPSGTSTISSTANNTTTNNASAGNTTTNNCSTSNSSTTNTTTSNASASPNLQNEEMFEKVISLYNEGNYSSIFEMFSTAMARLLDLEKTKTFFGSRKNTYGKITSKSYRRTADKFIAYDITYERGSAIFNFGIDSQNKICYLQLANEKKTAASSDNSSNTTTSNSSTAAASNSSTTATSNSSTATNNASTTTQSATPSSAARTAANATFNNNGVGNYDENLQNAAAFDEVITLYNQGDYEGIFSLFSSTMARVLNLENTKKLFETRKTKYGNILAKYHGNILAKYVSYYIHYEQGTGVFNIGFDAQGKINYLQLPSEKRYDAARSQAAYDAVYDSPRSIEVSPTHFIFPGKGHWFTFWGGRTTRQNFHTKEIYKGAYDFFVVGSLDVPYKNKREKLTDYYAYNQPLFSSCDGTVVAVENSLPEFDPPKAISENGLGNYVKVRTVNNEYWVIAHMIPGSVVVKVGQKIKQGDPIGRCGNSGNSTQPHIHTHLQNQENNDGAIGLEMVYDNIVVNGETKNSWAPLKNEFIWNVEK